MNDITITWQPKTGNYELGFDGYLGAIRIAQVTLTGKSKVYFGPRWRLDTLLPGLSVRSGLLCETKEEAQEVALRATRTWLLRAGLVGAHT